MEFKDFAKNNGFEHVISTQDIHKALDSLQQMFKYVTNMSKKAKKSNSDPYLALLEFR